MLTSEAAASRVFVRARRGYRRDEVEAIRARVVVALTLTERGLTAGVPIGADDLVGAEFGYGRGGYDHRDVDRLLDEAAAVLRRRGVLMASPPRAPGREVVDAKRLRRTRGGYDRDEVGAFVQEALGALDAWEGGVRPAMASSEADRRTFASRRRGYDPDGVEALVGIVTRLLAAYERDNPEPETTPEG